MLTISKDPHTELLGHRLAQRVGAIAGVALSDEQRVALLLIASTLPDTAQMVDLVAASAIDNAVAVALMSDSVGHFGPLRIVLQSLGQQQVQVPLFEPFTTDQRFLGAKLDGSPTHMQTSCPVCRDKVQWKAESWRDIKERPIRCKAGHVFSFSSGSFAGSAAGVQ
ncbi:hypothetical protein Q3O97_05940 [Ralstonia pseudosolanacearum]|uniref:hypothetical protein n=1 Tax=Ralstonia pseudosolanacearum TaxID=1310165 RepID=UPI00270A2507|nr:hypothetical protein [Ralstonia pseudosolanacearum]MDO3615380.1 hypothetical protein [Ralstonia pseudosolanacearum]